jgi:hypothetical protein
MFKNIANKKALKEEMAASRAHLCRLVVFGRIQLAILLYPK